MRSRLPTITWYCTLVILAGMAWLAIQHHIDPDLWWRMRHGQDIIAHGLSAKDTYDYTMPSFPFVSHAWTFDILVGWLNRFGGYQTLVTFITLFTSVAFAAVTFKNRSSWLGPLQLLILWAGAIGFFGVRAQVLAWPFPLITLWLCFLPADAWRTWRWVIPAFALLWANIHGSFPVLFVLLAIRTAVAWYESHKIDLIDLGLILSIIPLSLVNPYGIGLWREVWLTNTDPTLRSTIGEWQPIWKQTTTVLILFSLLLGGSAALAVMKQHWRAFALICATGLLGISSVRHIPLFVFTVVFALAATVPLYNLHNVYKAIQKDVVIRRLTKGLATIGVLFLLWAPIEAVAFATPSSYPEAAVEFLQNHYPNAVVLNHYNWGGYLIWARPEGKVFIDGRMPSWRWQAPAGELDWAHRDWTAIGKGDKTLFEKDVALFGIDTVLWTTPWAGKSDLLNLLKDEGWLPVYADEIAVIYRKPGSNP